MLNYTLFRNIFVYFSIPVKNLPIDTRSVPNHSTLNIIVITRSPVASHCVENIHVLLNSSAPGVIVTVRDRVGINLDCPK